MKLIFHLISLARQLLVTLFHLYIFILSIVEAAEAVAHLIEASSREHVCVRVEAVP